MKKTRTTLQILLIAFAGLSPLGAQEELLRFEASECLGCSWYKGNTHAHTTESDGDSSPEYVALWYKDHGYDFLILSDHNTITDPGALAHLVGDGWL